MDQDQEFIRNVILDTMEVSLEAQLRAIRRLRSAPAELDSPKAGMQSMSHIDMTFDILASAQQPLHVSDIIERIAARFGQQVDRESLVSSLSKRVARNDRFQRTDKNTFALLPGVIQ